MLSDLINTLNQSPPLEGLALIGGLFAPSFLVSRWLSKESNNADTLSEKKWLQRGQLCTAISMLLIIYSGAAYSISVLGLFILLANSITAVLLISWVLLMSISIFLFIRSG